MSDEIPTVEIDFIRQECPPLIDNLSLINEVYIVHTDDALNNISNVKIVIQFISDIVNENHKSSTSYKI